MKKLILALATIIVLAGVCVAQTAPKDISSVVAAGKVNANRYENAYFGLTLAADDADWKAPSFVNVEGRRARLVDAFSKSAIWEKIYTFSILADLLSNHPQLKSTTQYVRSVRHQLEREGLQTIREEFPIEVSGIPFTGAVLKESYDGGRVHVRGMYSTFMNGYILTLDVTAPSEERLQQLVSSMVKFKPQPRP
jgi:hypothetical protein